MDESKTVYLDEFADFVLGKDLRPPSSSDFLGLIEAKLELGTRKYGAESWRHHDMIREMLAELVDVFNYAYLEWRVLREIRLDTTQPQVFMRAEGLLRRIALEAFNSWASMMRLVSTFDALEIPHSVSGEDRVGPGVVEEMRRAAEATGPVAGEGDAAGAGDRDSEVSGEPADTATGDGSGDAPARRRRAHASPDPV